MSGKAAHLTFDLKMTLFRLILLRVPDGLEIESFRNINFDAKKTKEEEKNPLCTILFS